MIGYCEDYPCCGHTLDDPCQRQWLTWVSAGPSFYEEDVEPGEEWWQPDTNAEARGDA